MSKINDENLRTVQVTFNKLKEYDNVSTDTRFTEVLIKILHLGRNYNGSVFNKEAVQNAIPSLANIPILGFLENNKENEEDFSDHRLGLVEQDGKKVMRYLGNCYGVIPESFAKDAYFEDELSSDGISRTYLFVKGLLFNKFDYALNIFDKSEGSKAQSMELDEQYQAHWEDNGFVFDEFKFGGACILGKNVCPAMIDSEITTKFSTKSVAEEIENKLNEFAKYFSKKEEEQENMAKIEDIVEQTEVKDEEIVVQNFAKEEPTKVDDEPKTEDIAKEEEDFAKKLDDSEVVKEDEKEFAKEDEVEDIEKETEEDFAKEDEKVEDKMACDDKEKKYTLTFSLSHEDIRCQLYDKLWDMGNLENTCYGIVETNDNYFKYVDYCTGQFYKQMYVKSEESVSFTGEREEIFNVFVDKATKDAISNVTYSKLQHDLDEANNKIQEYSKSNEQLLKYQLDIKENERKQEINEVISRFSKINELDLEKYKQKAYNKEISKDELEVKLYAELGKMNFSKITGEEVEEKIEAPINYTVSLQEQNKCPYEGCEGLFS